MKIGIIVIGILVIGLLLGYLVWDSTHITVGDVIYPKNLEALDLSGQALPPVRELADLAALKRLDLRYTGLTADEYEYLKRQLPECEILWLVPFQGEFLSPDIRELSVTELSNSDLSMLKYFPELKILDGRECEDLAALFTAGDRCPQCQILYRVPLEGKYWDWDAKSIDCTGSSMKDLLWALTFLPHVESVFISQPVEDWEWLDTIVEGWPEVAFSYSLSLLGKTVPQDAQTLDLSGIPMESTKDLEECLPLLPELKKVDMVGCGISDEEMAALNQRWPDILFVWEIQIGHFTLRTDITYFMPYQYRYVLSDKDADQLKYLTELICLDFGHMDITRTDYLAYMPKLQYLLMADTPITDLSPCANLKELKYAEFFMTDVKDFSPLLECPNLVDLNVCYTYPTDPMIFAKMQQLENLWFRGMQDEAIITALKEALPNTKTVFRKGSSTGAGWRELPNYYAQRDILGMGYMTG